MNNIKKEIILNNDEHYYEIIRKNIKNERLKRNLTQQMLADMAGLSREYITDIKIKKEINIFQ